MLIILSPSKTINFHTPAPPFETTWPIFSSKANKIITSLRHFSAEDIAQRERVSLKIAFTTRNYFHSFSTTQHVGKPALFAYTGNVFDKLNPATFSEDDINYTQEHLRIFSALYGVLRPMDIIQPYRLDMNSKLIDGLYDIWQEQVTKEISKLLKTDDNTLINLASAEYFKMLNQKQLPANCKIITPVFKQEHNGKYTVNSLFAKQARGWMSRYIIENRISNPEHLQGFTEGGYYFRPELSNNKEWIFTR